jgi:hypothetical protein
MQMQHLPKARQKSAVDCSQNLKYNRHASTAYDQTYQPISPTTS